MDRSECERLVEKHRGPLVEFVGVGHWRLKFVVGACDDRGNTAECQRNTPYDIATITVDHDKFEDESFLLDTLFHELTHLLLAPMDVYRQNYCQAVEPNSVEDKREDMLWCYSIEQTVVNFERLWRRHLKALYLKQFEPVPEPDPSTPS